MDDFLKESFDESEMDMTLDEATDDGFEIEMEGSGCSTKECDDPVKEEDDMDDDYEPDEDDVLDVEESMLDDAYDVYSTVHEADDASVENIEAYEKSKEALFDGESSVKDVEDMMDDELGSDMVVSDDLDVLGVNNDDMVVVPDEEL